MVRHGWTVVEGVTLQLRKLQEATARAWQKDSQGFESNANVKLFRALSHLIIEAMPADPGRDEFRQGNTLGTTYRQWRRAKIGRSFRLFFRYDSKSKVIVYTWINHENTLRSAGIKSDPYAVFEKMQSRRNPPDDWDALTAATRSDWDEPKA
ncbi:type II toxin-antitoxin system YhaV family toxin [Pseudomonas putida]|uniref:type II toxin-antitoxin system YhaV family toxin n=1 Tax=Pseudomonas putida TaxID=303 RepID=UPI0018AC67B3|nr:type II toxin-antitoxin system YhaV family toxin [Pseudomonas putida]MBF8661561.1 type II toxin-antitoxin system YhaV family toxin [Pseudomonas putida]